MLDSIASKLSSSLSKNYDTLNRVETSASALKHNLELIGNLADRPVAPVLKANAYGHGLIEVAKVFDGHTPFMAVDGYFEALNIRKAGIKSPLLVMGHILPENFKNIQLENFWFLVSIEETIKAIGETNKPATVHLEINSGMNRQGVSPKDLPEIISLLKQFPKIKVGGLMSHLADSDNSKSMTDTNNQIVEFKNAYEIALDSGLTPEFIHLSQSAGATIKQPDFVNLVRPGISIYGINPLDRSDKRYNIYANLKPAMRVVSKLIATHDLQAGDSVSYGFTYTAEKPMRIGTIPFGYHEGLPRDLSNKASLMNKNGKALPIRGRINMNHTMIDITDTDLTNGDEIIVFSDNPEHYNSIQKLCEDYSPFSYELMVNINESIRRQVVI